MVSRTLNGDQAMAYGALFAGVKFVAGYPGSPSSGTVEALVQLAKEHDMYVEWSTNEKVAVEMAIGASMAGRRALVCVKSVGANVMVDPLMVLNLTPVNGGLVILLGDDPGGYGSQNDQDTRPLASLVETPMMEPAGPAEACAMMREAFQVSERFHTAVIIRETRSFTLQSEPVVIAEGPLGGPGLDLARESWRFVPVPRNAVAKHRDLHERLQALARWADSSPYNRIIGTGAKGIVGVGFAFRKLLDVLGEGPAAGLRLLKLGSLYPLPGDLISRFMAGCDEILVLEENAPYVEIRIKAMAHDLACAAAIFGKQSGHIVLEGELLRRHIREALFRFLPEQGSVEISHTEDEADEMPKRESNCGGCTYGQVLDILEDAAGGLNQRPILVGDPGCLVTIADRLDAKYAMGSAVGVADGIAKAGATERAVALFGDSSFFHTAIPAICNAAWNGSDILMVVLDNGSTAATGFQPNPGTGEDAMGREAAVLKIEEIARACGVKRVYAIGPDDPDAVLRKRFRETLSRRELTLIVVRTECERPDSAL
jgi:indolepyruvate ferredoxin oxidoreductase alpha subunit